MVTGYVCALKPIRLYANGNQERALVSITKSAFRRIPRLVLPASIATTLIWIICQLGGFEVTKHVQSWWLIYTSPNKLPLGPAIANLGLNLITTWVREWNVYEPNQWTLLPLLKGAFLVYMMLFATAYMKPRYRMVVEMALFVYYYIANDRMFPFSSTLPPVSPHILIYHLLMLSQPNTASTSSSAPSSATSPNSPPTPPGSAPVNGPNATSPQS